MIVGEKHLRQLPVTPEVDTSANGRLILQRSEK